MPAEAAPSLPIDRPMPHAATDRPAPPPAAPRHRITADLAEIARELWQTRELLHQLTLRDIRIRYKQAVMGFGWAVLMPGLIVLAGVIVRVAMLQLSGGTLDRLTVAGLALKGLGWAFVVGAIGFAVQSLTGNANLVSKIYFPREVLPLASTLAQAFDATIGAMVVAGLLLILGVPVTATALWALPLALLLVLQVAAAALILSCGNLFFRDVKYLVQVGLTFGIFFTPVLFEPAMLGNLGATIAMLNPVAPILEGLRLAVVQGHDLLEPLVVHGRDGAAVTAWQPWYLAYAAAWGIGGLLLGSVAFHRLEFAFAERV